MAEEEKIIKPEEVKEEESKKEVVKVPKKEGFGRNRFDKVFDVEAWKPKTEVGKLVKNGEVTSVDYLFDNGIRIKEAEIIDVLLPGMEADLLLVGQSKGKFGGGKRRIFRQTQKKTKEGNKPKFATIAVIGNGEGVVGLGYGKSKETVPAREKSIRNAKLNLIKLRRGCGSWECTCRTNHSIPFTIEGKYGSIRIKIMPAPRGTGLRMESECSKILKAAGIKDVWSKTIGQTKTKLNHIYACFDALKKLSTTKISEEDSKNLGITSQIEQE